MCNPTVKSALFLFFSFLYAVPESAQAFACSQIFTMGIYDRFCFIQLKFIILIYVLLLGMVLMIS